MMKKIALLAAMLSLCFHAKSNECSYTVGADWLYWKAFQDNMEYASNNISTNGGSIFTYAPINPDFAPRSGYRVFADYCFCKCPLHLAALFTRFSSQVDTNTNLNPANIGSAFIVMNNQNFPIFNVFSQGNLVIPFSNVETTFSLHFNYLDLDLYRTFCCHPCFQITPHMGLRGMWLKEKMDFSGFAPTIPGIFFAEFVEHYDGYGLEGGLGADLKLGWGFSLVGKLGGSLLYARIKIDQDVSYIAGGTDTLLSLDETTSHLSPTIDGFIGLEYQHLCGCYPIEVHVGWEQHLIINANHLNVNRYSDLTLQGLTLGGSIGF